MDRFDFLRRIQEETKTLQAEAEKLEGVVKVLREEQAKLQTYTWEHVQLQLDKSKEASGDLGNVVLGNMGASWDSGSSLENMGIKEYVDQRLGEQGVGTVPNDEQLIKAAGKLEMLRAGVEQLKKEKSSVERSIETLKKKTKKFRDWLNGVYS